VQAPIAVAVEIRALDTGPRLVRAFRLSLAIGEDGLRLERDLPFEAGRPVGVELVLPDDARPLRATGTVLAVPPEDEEREGEAARPRAVRFAALDPDARSRVARYVEERMTPWQSA
jgi:hypothetical protein